MVTTQEESYHLVRNDDGWVLSEKGSYPVTDARIQELTEALSNITYAEPMTRDEQRAKLRGCLRFGLDAGDAAADRLADAVDTLEAAPDAARALIDAFPR
jgi:hypothetical protein